MPICSCPHCNTFLKVKESQLNVAQGFVRCTDCQGLFKAKDFVAKQQVSSIDWMADGVSDIETVRRIGTYVRGRNAFDKQQIDYLLEHPSDGSQAAAVPHDRERLAARAVPLPEPPPRTAAPAAAKSGDTNWTLATLVALTILILQLFYILLTR